MKTYKTVIIGCGLMSHNHIRGYLATRRFEIVAIADFHESAMNEVDDIFSIKPRHYTDARGAADRVRAQIHLGQRGHRRDDFRELGHRR